MEFVEIIENLAKYSVISFSVKLAKDLGIFEILRAADEPLTSQQVADAKKLKERYVREILGSLTSLKLVKISAGQGEPTYFIQQEVKDKLDEGALTELTSLDVMSSIYAPVKACCHADGPLSSRYTDGEQNYLDECVAAYGDQTLSSLIDNTPDMKAKLEQGIQVIEFGSGYGRLLSMLAKRFPKSTFTASEVNSTIVTKMKDKWSNIPNMHFEIFDLCQMTQFPSTKFDWILMVDVMHDLPHPSVAMRNIREMMKDDGYFTLCDKASTGNLLSNVGNDTAAFYYSVGTFLCIPESFQAEDSEAHGPTWSKDFVVSSLNQSGFNTVNVFDVDKFNKIFVCGCKKQIN